MPFHMFCNGPVKETPFHLMVLQINRWQNKNRQMYEKDSTDVRINMTLSSWKFWQNERHMSKK